jgi:hypothetical protein
MDVSRSILIVDTSAYKESWDTYFITEGVYSKKLDQTMNYASSS